MIYDGNKEFISAIYDKNEWKIILFRQFLQISPYYRAARNFEKSRKAAPKRADATRLYNTADRFGDVWDGSHEDWWDRNGKKHLGEVIQPKVQIAAKLTNLSLPQWSELSPHHRKIMINVGQQVGKYFDGQHARDFFPDVALIAVPLSGNRRDIDRQVQTAVTEAFRGQPEGTSEKTIVSFQSNKIRKNTLEKYIFAVKWRALNKDATLYDLGEVIAEKYKEDGRKNDDRNPANLSSQTSELLRKASYVADWAALGEFPKSNKPSTVNSKDVRFDRPFIKQQIELGKITPP